MSLEKGVLRFNQLRLFTLANLLIISCEREAVMSALGTQSCLRVISNLAGSDALHKQPVSTATLL